MAEQKALNDTNIVENLPPKDIGLPKIVTRRSCLCKCCFFTGGVCIMFLLLAFILIFVAFPVAVMSSIEIQRSLLFEPSELPSEVFLNTSRYINGTRNFYVTVNKAQNITLGAWHFLPEALVNESLENSNFSFIHALAKPDYPVLLHFHGNGGSRWNYLHTFLTFRQYFHVIAFDYRSYGDSTKAELTEVGLVEDSITFYKWLKARTAPDNIYVWGHSLGSAVSTHTLARLKNEDIRAMGLILESPFTNLREGIKSFFLSKYLDWLPWFDATMLDGFEKSGFHFKTSENILKVDCPILILHAEDDVLISYTHAEKLMKIAQEKRDPVTQGKVYYYLFPGELGYNHWGISVASETLDYLKKFMNVCEEYNEQAEINTTKNKH